MFNNYLVHELFEFMDVHELGWQFMNFMKVSFVVQEHSWVVHEHISFNERSWMFINYLLWLWLFMN